MYDVLQRNTFKLKKKFTKVYKWAEHGFAPTSLQYIE